MSKLTEVLDGGKFCGRSPVDVVTEYYEVAITYNVRKKPFKLAAAMAFDVSNHLGLMTPEEYNSFHTILNAAHQRMLGDSTDKMGKAVERLFSKLSSR